MSVEFFFDLICPWCWIGMRSLKTAMDEFRRMRPEMRQRVRWRPHPLLPETPLAGASYQSFYLGRLGSPTAAALRREQVQHAGRAAGIAFDFDRIHVLPNTAAAHCLVAHMAKRKTGLETIAMVEQLFSAFFLEGQDIGDLTVLERLGMAHGAERSILLTRLAEFQTHLAAAASPRGRRGRRGRSRKEDLSGVPHFIFNRTVAVSGAQPPGVLLRGMLRSVGD